MKLLAVVPLIVAVLAPLPAQGQSSPHGKLSINCADCHTADSWTRMASPMAFSHEKTRFPLTGQHARAACRQCHATLVFDQAPLRCEQCHQDVHRGELGASCDRCHNPQSWLVPDMIERHAQAGFTLVGAHRTAPCQACHVNEQQHEFVGLSTDCYTCHRADYDATAMPPHRASGMGTDCATCHSMNATNWGGSFDHASTGFPLTGVHASISCSSCHGSKGFGKLPTDCASCHMGEFNATVNPNHASAGIPTQCQTCHTTAAWQPASFDHSKTSFALTGAHVNVPCASCHKNGVFAGTPTACSSCHTADYNATTDPNHAAAGFPLTCQTCHTTTAWTGATFNHTWFPMTHGNAAGVCATCHTNPTDYSVFQCTNCHTQAQTDPQHVGISGYSYNSRACYSCHPTGRTG